MEEDDEEDLAEEEEKPCALAVPEVQAVLQRFCLLRCVSSIVRKTG